MDEKKKEIVETIAKEMPGMTEKDKTYLVGFLEGMSAGSGNQQITAERPVA